MIFTIVSGQLWDIFLKRHFLFIWLSYLTGCPVFYLPTLALPIICNRDEDSESYKGDKTSFIISVGPLLAEWKTAKVWYNVSSESLLSDSQQHTFFQTQSQRQIFTWKAESSDQLGWFHSRFTWKELNPLLVNLPSYAKCITNVPL